MILGRHPRDLLARAAEGHLSAAERSRLDAHLKRCERCRGELEAIARAAGALRDAAGSPPTMPPGGRDRLLRAARDERRVPPRLVGRLAAAGAAASAVALAYFAITAARVRVVPADGERAAFETLALETHRELRGAEPALALASGEPAAIRRWLADNGGFAAALADERPGEAAGAYRLLGAAGVERDGLRAAAVVTRIDGLPVTLLVGHETEVTGIPAWSWLGKRLLVRRDPRSGAHLLSWRNAGKAYTLVTDDVERPERACQLCHVDARRRRAIERVAESL